jgi:hypothetical protein
MEDRSVFLSEEDVLFLTGYTLPSKQCEHLTMLNIPYWKDRAGHPRVLRRHLESTSTAPPSPLPDFTTLDVLLRR